MGRVQLGRLPSFISRRREIASRFTDAFKSLPLGIPQVDGHVFFRYVVSTPERGTLEQHLNSNGIEAKRPVYKAAHLYFGGGRDEGNVVLEADYPNSDRAHLEALSMPIHPSLSDDEVDVVVQSVTEFFESRD